MGLIYFIQFQVVLSTFYLLKITFLFEKLSLDLLEVHFKNSLNWQEEAMLVLTIEFYCKTTVFADTQVILIRNNLTTKQFGKVLSLLHGCHNFMINTLVDNSLLE